MSARLSTITKRATIVRRATATGPDGRSATFTVYADETSHGYHTGYTRVPTRWYAVDAPGVVRRCWRYTGRRIDQAERDYAAAVAQIDGDGSWTITESRP